MVHVILYKDWKNVLEKDFFEGHAFVKLKRMSPYEWILLMSIPGGDMIDNAGQLLCKHYITTSAVITDYEAKKIYEDYLERLDKEEKKF